MELEFDKEIDSLLRKNGEGVRGVLVGDPPGGSQRVHLDADQLSAFAENAVPEKSRGLYMSHLADCDRCRRILSGLIALNAESEPVKEPVVAPVISVAGVEPWYRRLLLPNLAYVMGGLVLVFGGLITFSLLQSSTGSETISQSVANTSSARGPMEVADELQSTAMPSNSNATAASDQPLINANASSNVSVAANTSPSGQIRGKEADAAPADDRASVVGESIDANKPVAAAPLEAPLPPPSQPKPEANEVAASTLTDSDRREEKARSVEKKKDAGREREDTALAAKQAQDIPRTQAGGVSKPTPGPNRDGAQNFPNRANNTYELYEEKRVSGKNFRNRDGVWYDLAYSGQATTSVRRRSDEYRKLDSGLRTIAESLSGVVVVMWKDKAYRIQ